MNPVPVDELQRAWRAIVAGEFRRNNRHRATGVGEWTPGRDEGVLPVLGAGGGVGATTLALALATAHRGPARVVECAPAGASGLAAASYSELGAAASGWVRGTRDHVTLERCPALWTTTTIAVPAPVDGAGFTVVDACAGAVHGGRAGWLTRLLDDARVLVVAGRATVPGLRRLEAELDAVPAGRRVVAAVLGPPRGRWPRELRAVEGPGTRQLADDGLLVALPLDRGLATCGITPAPLPAVLVAAAAAVLDRVEGVLS